MDAYRYGWMDGELGLWEGRGRRRRIVGRGGEGRGWILVYSALLYCIVC